jgi:hypothetical protein
MAGISFRINPLGTTSSNVMLDYKLVNNGSNNSTLYWTFNSAGGFNDRMSLTSAGALNVATSVTSPQHIGTITSSGSGDSNAPFRFGSDYSGWMTHVAGTPGSNNGWGLFWAGDSGAQYGTNQAGAAGNIWSNSTNPNEYVFVGNGTTVMSVHGNTGNVWIKGETKMASKLSVSGNADFGATSYSYAGPAQYGGLVFPRGQILFSNTNSQNQFYLSSNAYTNASGVFAYRNSTQPALALGLDNGGMSFLVAGNGTADAAVSWTTAFSINNSGNSAFSGNVSLNSASGSPGAVGYLLYNYSPQNGGSRSWKISNDQLNWGDFVIQVSTTQTGSTFISPLQISSAGVATFSGNVVNSASYKANTFVQLTSIATKTFSTGGVSSSSFAVTDFSGVPSNAKAISVYGWYHITGYGSGAGQGDHAVSWFGLTNDTAVYSWGGAGTAWPGNNSTFSAQYYGSFSMEHDGDASGANMTNYMHYYGSLHNGIINVNSNGSIYYTLAFGYSGGTHHNALYCTGYWI